MVEAKYSSNSEILSAKQKRNGFHGKYLAICKSKNLTPVSEVKAKNRNIQALDFHADRVKVADWIAICSALYNDNTLSYLAIRLRKNSHHVLEQADTLKKAKEIVNLPVIYAKFLFTELVDALKNLLSKSSRIKTLILEGLPLRGHYVEHLLKGLTGNTSIKTLSFTRGNIGDDACESICVAIQHVVNVETLCFSSCNLGIKGAEAVANLIKLQKIQRFSEAWIKSLRYQNVDAESIPGLKKITLTNNPTIGDEGLRVLTDILLEDAWIKDIDMQNCGLSDEGAQHIINCLNENKTIASFNINGNVDVSEHLRRHIMLNLGNSDSESSSSIDSSKSNRETVTKKQLIEEVNFANDRLHNEIFYRKKCEALNEKLNQLLIETQKQLAIQGAFQIPEGFTLVANQTLAKLLKEAHEEVGKTPSNRSLKRRERRRLLNPRKVRSCVVARSLFTDPQVSKSECLIEPMEKSTQKTYIERSIGDVLQNQSSQDAARPISGADLLQAMVQNQKSDQQGVNSIKALTELDAGAFGDCSQDSSVLKEMKGASLLQMFTRHKKSSDDDSKSSKTLANFDPRSLFRNSPKRAPYNSNNNSDAGSENQ